MKVEQAKKAFSDKYIITVRTKAGCAYHVAKDTVEVATDDFTKDDGYVYGERVNGSMGGPFRRRTQGQLRWFMLSNVFLCED